MNITKSHITNGASRPGTKLKSVRRIVIHWTANRAKGAGAKAHLRFFNKPSTTSSYHYIVENREVTQLIPTDEISHHSGKFWGRTREGIEWQRFSELEPNPNYHSVSIAMCVNVDSDFGKTFFATAKLTAQLLCDFGLSIGDIFRHFDLTRKKCPLMLVEPEGWALFIHAVLDEYEKLNA